ncbi:MAG: glycosyl hydrolase [Anaerolineae bacterium]|nr:glycosyl hydrolase [Anaerolineae bacterium]
MTTQTVVVSVAEPAGRIKPLQGVNNGPEGYGSLVDVSPAYRDLAVPYVRLHDPNWPHPREVDIPQVFPDFGADPDDPAAYDFRRTDAYLQKIVDAGAQIIYRLGVSIEHTDRKYYTDPPRDFTRWAAICLGIVKHYNYGWADGYRDRVAYWEVWNEADIGDAMWSGTPEQYFELYETTSKMLKAYDPGIRVGGPATARYERPHPAATFLERFLAHCRAHDCPLDFVSWHKYTVDPRVIEAHAHEVRGLLERYGYGGVESHLNEWNYGPANWDIWGPDKELARREAFERQKNEVGAAFVAATLILLQDAGVDVATYYDGQPMALFCGLFDYYGVRQKAFCAMRSFRELLDYPGRVHAELIGDGAGLRCLAAADPFTGETAALLSRFDGEPGPVDVRFEGLPGDADLTYSVVVVDRESTYAQVERGHLGHGVNTVATHMDRYAVALIKVDRADRPGVRELTADR